MKKHIDSLEVIRTIAFLGVFCSHSGIIVFSPGGVWGVSLFLILSGFLMVYSYYDRPIIPCIKDSILLGIRKIKKLYPLHIVTMILAFPFLFNETDTQLPFSKITKLFINISLLQSWIPKTDYYFSLNSVSWYLSSILFSYFLFPFVLSTIKKYKGISNSILAIIFTFSLQTISAFAIYLLKTNYWYSINIHWFTYIFPLSRFEDFYIGCNLGYIFINSRGRTKIKRLLFSLFEIGVLTISAIQWGLYLFLVTIPARRNLDIESSTWWRYTSMWTIPSCLLIYLFALNNGIISKKLTNKVVLWFGHLSAYSFLIHQIVFRYIEIVYNKTNCMLLSNKFFTLILCIITTVLCSYIWDSLSCIIKKERSP